MYDWVEWCLLIRMDATPQLSTSSLFSIVPSSWLETHRGMMESVSATSRRFRFSLARLERASGVQPKGWHSIARSQSWRTADILAEHGLKYTCDWVNDELPYRFTNGLVNMPLNTELSDRMIIATQQHSVEGWAQMMRDAFDWLAAEAKGTNYTSGGGRMLPMQLTPYIIGQPYRISALEQLLADLTNREDAWFATGDEIVAEWERQQ